MRLPAICLPLILAARTNLEALPLGSDTSLAHRPQYPEALRKFWCSDSHARVRLRMPLKRAKKRLEDAKTAIQRTLATLPKMEVNVIVIT
jgi:hypothetical protein